MIKIKTFVSKSVGTHYDDLDASKMDEEINNFTKNHKVISVTPVSFVEGNSIPTSVIVYTIVYEEAERMTAEKRNELDLVLDKIDMRSGSYIEFEVMTKSGPSKRLAFDRMTGKSIVKSWGDKILSYELKN